MDSLVRTIHVFSEDIGIEFGIEKCAMLVIVLEKGKMPNKDLSQLESSKDKEVFETN